MSKQQKARAVELLHDERVVCALQTSQSAICRVWHKDHTEVLNKAKTQYIRSGFWMARTLLHHSFNDSLLLLISYITGFRMLLTWKFLTTAFSRLNEINLTSLSPAAASRSSNKKFFFWCLPMWTWTTITTSRLENPACW